MVVRKIQIGRAEKGVALAADKHGKVKLVLQVAAITAVLLDNFPFAYLTNVPIDMTIMLIAVALTAYSGFKYMKDNYRELQLER